MNSIRSRIGFYFVLPALAAACSGSNTNSSSGGAIGGTGTVVGRTGGSTSIGGAGATGGLAAAGGAGVGGGTTEVTNTGGAANIGGAANTGGVRSTGGTSSLGVGGSLATGGAVSGGSPGSGGSTAIKAPWDWAGIIGTGQSLAVGAHGTPLKATTQPFHNLKMSSGTAAWPLDPNDSSFKMVPLVEPVGRYSTSYPSSYPTNIDGETAHTAMSDQITSLAMAAGSADYVNVHGEFGEDGQGIVYLVKNATPSGVNGRAYQGTLIETQAITRLAKAAGKTYGVGAIIVTHGETDCGNASYETQLYGLLQSYSADIPAITGQKEKILMIVSQQNSLVDRSPSTLAQWKIGNDHPTEAVLACPKYQYPYFADDHVHLVTDGYDMLGEKYGEVYYNRVVLGNGWLPLQPTSVDRTGARQINVHYHVPVPPMVWDTGISAPNANSAAWRNGKGFEVRANNNPVTISSVAISSDTVQITVATDLPSSNVVVGYAMTSQDGTTASTTTDGAGNSWVGTFRWGQLRDSDPFVGYVTKRAQPNYGVAFEMTVP